MPVKPRMIIPAEAANVESEHESPESEVSELVVVVDDVVALLPPSFPKIMIPAFANVVPKLRIAAINPVMITFFNIFFLSCF